MSDLILDLELVPKTSWWDNARTNLAGQWDAVRQAVYEEADGECGIDRCESKVDIHAHEEWEYDEDSGLQILRDVNPRCGRCHEVHHFGYAQTQDHGDRAFKRFMGFNDLDKQSARDIIEQRFETWQERNRVEWELDLTFLDAYYGVTIPDKFIKRGPKANE